MNLATCSNRYTACVQIRENHQRAIDRLADAYRDDPRFRALIIGGSVAKGCAARTRMWTS